MREIAIVTDDAAALPAEWLEEHREGLAVVGMPVMVDDQALPLGEPKLPSSLVVALAEGRKVTTSRPSPGQFLRVYEQLAAHGYREIVSVHLSAELSGTVSSARIAAQSVDVPVTVIDTRTVAMDQGFGVMAAWEAAGSGADRDEIVAAARGHCGNTVLLYVPSLDQLKRGGRLSPSIARLGTALQIKPLLGLKDGKLAPVEMPRTAAKARSRLVSLAVDALSRNGADPGEENAGSTHVEGAARPEVVIHHLADPDGARELADELVQAYRPDVRITIAEIPAVLAAHVGIGVRAVIVRTAP